MAEILTKEFSLGDVLSITTEKLVSERHMEGVYDILNWMTGDSIFTHQIPRAMEACKPVLIAQFPQLDPEQNPQLMFAVGELVEMLKSKPGQHSPRFLILGWLSRLRTEYGDSFQVVPLREWQSKDPLVEAAEMFGADKVSAVAIPDSDTFPASVDTGEPDVKWESELTV